MNENQDNQPRAGDGLKHSSPAETLRDRFELLSAYLDGEVTAAERRQVEGWLANDADVQCLHARLLKLRQGMRSIPVPASNQPVEQTVTQVFSRLDRRPRKALAWGGAIAALFMGAIVSGQPGLQSASDLAQSPAASSNPNVSSVALMIPLDRPVIEIPKAAVSTPARTGATALNEMPDIAPQPLRERLR